MKSITNTSLQAFQLFLDFPEGIKAIFIKPKETLVVPSSAVSRQCTIMSKRKLLKIKSV